MNQSQSCPGFNLKQKLKIAKTSVIKFRNSGAKFNNMIMV